MENNQIVSLEHKALIFRRNIYWGILISSLLSTIIIILFAILVSGGFGLSLDSFLNGRDPKNANPTNVFNSQGPLIFIWACILLVLFVFAYWVTISLLIFSNVYRIKKLKSGLITENNDPRYNYPWAIKKTKNSQKNVSVNNNFSNRIKIQINQIIFNSTLFILLPIALILSITIEIIVFKQIKTLKGTTKQLVINTNN